MLRQARLVVSHGCKVSCRAKPRHLSSLAQDKRDSSTSLRFARNDAFPGSFSAWMVGLCLVLLVSQGVCGQDAAELELDHSMSTEFETPHTKWAKPYARGKLRVLLFCSGHGTAPREGVELKQRFDVDVDAVFWARIVDSSKQGWHGGELGVQRMLRLAEKPYDAYVFLGVSPTDLNSEMQYKVLKPVVDGGAGIVLVGVDDARVLKPLRRIADLPPFIAQAEPKAAFQVGKGRGVQLSARPDIPYAYGWQLLYEQWQERLGRAIVWAAGREPEMPLTWGRAVMWLRAGDAATVSVPSLHWKNPGRKALRVAAHIYAADGRCVSDQDSSTTLDWAEGRWAFPVNPVALDSGDYLYRVTLLSERGIEAWAECSYRVRWDEFAVREVTLDRSWGEVGERIRGRARLASPEAARDLSLVVRLRDPGERILVQQPIAGGNVAAFDLPIEPWFPMLLRVEAAVLDKGGVARGSAYQYFNVTKRHRGQFNFLIWDVPTGPLAPYAEESLARLGMTLQLRGGPPPRVVAAYDVAWVPYTTRIQEAHTKEGVMKPFCWNDEAKVAEHVQQLAEKYREARQHGVFVYSLGDENDVRGSCTSPHCLKAYRGYLAKEYGTIEALNASWGSAFKSFDEVELFTPDDNQGAEAKRQRNFPRWYDREAFRSWNYVEFCKKFAKAYRAIDPQSRTGFEGAGRFGPGDDLDLFVREMGFWSPYPGTADEVLRSIAPRDLPRANWMGYTKDAPSLISKYWRMITRGCDSVWWWRWDCIGAFHGFLAPHLGPYPATKELAEETRIVRDGLGTLLMNSEMLDSGIAMLFSHPSCYAGQLEGSYDGVEQNHIAWHRALRDMGLNFRYVTDRMLRLGEFDAKRYKVLILSRAEAIGPKEAAAIEAFVQGGGAVIADVRPGIYDGHCRPLADGCLDKLFGIRRTGRGPATKGQASLTDLKGERLRFDGALCDAGVEPTTAKGWGSCGGAPLMLGQGVGKGKTLLLNFAMASYPAYGSTDGPEEAADVVAALFDEAGVRPAIRVRTGGKRTRNLETVRWRNGEMEIIALWREKGEDEDVKVELAEPRWVYDLRHRQVLGKKLLGQQKAFPTRVLGSRPTFLVLAPRELPAVKATLDRAEAAPGERAKLRLEVPGAAGLHALRIEAATPDGKPAEWLHQVILVGSEPKEIILPIAFNDPEGKWEIRATDLFTDTPQVVTLAVKSR